MNSTKNELDNSSNNQMNDIKQLGPQARILKSVCGEKRIKIILQVETTLLIHTSEQALNPKRTLKPGIRERQADFILYLVLSETPTKTLFKNCF